jgi:pyruvate/2-oxoglutarate dehydrogenase complex dihydrolipoamide dehydrogenase (E3) component
MSRAHISVYEMHNCPNVAGADVDSYTTAAVGAAALTASGAVDVWSRYIAVEFAGIFKGLGVDVHLMFRADKVLRG